MKKATLKASLARWKSKLEKRRKKLKEITPDAKPERIQKWQKLRDKAERMVWRRQRQIEAAEVPLREKAYRHARTAIGIMEVGGNNMGAKVMEIIRTNGGTGPEPWCGDFMAWCYRLAGSTAVTRAWAAVRLYVPLSGIKRTSNPQRGMLVRFTFDHIGMFVNWCDSAGRAVPRPQATHIQTIEGNTGRSGAVSDSSTGGDGVYKKVRPIYQVRDYLAVTR